MHAEPFVEVRPADARSGEATSTAVSRGSRPAGGTCVLKVNVSEARRRGSLFVPVRWSDATSCDRGASSETLVMPEDRPLFRPARRQGDPGGRLPRSPSRSAGLRSRVGRLRCPTGLGRARVALAQTARTAAAPSDDGPAAWRDRAPAMFGDDAELAEN